MRETIGSFNSSSGGGNFGPSIEEPSVNLEWYLTLNNCINKILKL
jgi:hypothetical protein